MAIGTMGEVFVCFSCCVTQQPPRKRRRIDRSMIGHPTNFVHTGHIGADEMMDNGSSPSHENNLNSMETQMQTKGGYESSTPVHVNLDCIDLQVKS